ncbi:MAG: hypothetical protein KAJ01_10125, partial [Candidatus Hydrogenedentes bacterium]|nr:hypothetical protein [Candidatus Hydrogenedentota bacterium]
MRAASFTFTLLLVIIAICARPVLAEEESVGSSRTSSIRPSAMGMWGGMSYDSPTDMLLGATPGRDFHEVAFRITWRLVDVNRARVDYTLDLIPAAVLTRNPTASLSVIEAFPRRTMQLEARYA